MALEQLKPMDIYSSSRVPFDVAAYLRGHKFSIVASDLTRALKTEDAAKEAMDRATATYEDAVEKRLKAVEAAQKEMRKSDAN